MYAHLHVCMDVCRHGDTEDLDMCVCVCTCRMPAHACHINVILYICIFTYMHTHSTRAYALSRNGVSFQNTNKSKGIGGAQPPTQAQHVAKCDRDTKLIESYIHEYSRRFHDAPYSVKDKAHQRLNEKRGEKKRKRRRDEEQMTG